MVHVLVSALQRMDPAPALHEMLRNNPLLVRTRDDTTGWLPLHHALYNLTPPDIIQRMVELYPEALMEPNDTSTMWLPLHFAARYHAPLEVVKSLVERHPAALQQTNGDGWLPLHIAACYKAPYESVQCMVDTCPDALQQKNREGWLPLHLVARYSAPPDVIQYLVEKHPDALQERNHDGWLPLHMAARSGASSSVIKCFIEKNPHALQERNNDGWLPIHIASRYCENSALDVVQCLVDAHPKALEERLGDGWVAPASSELASSSNQVQCGDWLPLHLAAAYNASVEIVKYLTETSPTELLKQKTAEGWSLSHLAAGFNYSLGVVKYVMGLSPTSFLEKGTNGGLPLHMATRHGASVEIIMHLVDACPHALEVEDDDGCLPIHVAAQYASFGVVKVLVDARPHTLTYMSGNRGRYPLHIAARHSPSSDVIKLLVFRCPRVLYWMTPEGELPADLAWRSGKNDDAKWLEAAMKDRQWRLLATGPPAISLVPSSEFETGLATKAAPPSVSSSAESLPAIPQSIELGASPHPQHGHITVDLHRHHELETVASLAFAVTTPRAIPRHVSQAAACQNHESGAVESGASVAPAATTNLTSILLKAGQDVVCQYLQRHGVGRVLSLAPAVKTPPILDSDEVGTLASLASAVTTPMSNPRKWGQDEEACQRQRDDNVYQLQQELRIAQELIQQLEETCQRQLEELEALRCQKEAGTSVAPRTPQLEHDPFPEQRTTDDDIPVASTAETSTAPAAVGAAPAHPVPHPNLEVNQPSDSVGADPDRVPKPVAVSAASATHTPAEASAASFATGLVAQVSSVRSRPPGGGRRGAGLPWFRWRSSPATNGISGT